MTFLFILLRYELLRLTTEELSSSGQGVCFMCHMTKSCVQNVTSKSSIALQTWMVAFYHHFKENFDLHSPTWFGIVITLPAQES